MLTLIIWHNRFSENENEVVEAHLPRHRDSQTKKAQHRDSKAKKPRHGETETINPWDRDSKTFFQTTKSHDIEIPRLKNRDIEIPRLKPTTSSFRGILILMPPDSIRLYVPPECSSDPVFHRRSLFVVPWFSVPGFIVCPYTKPWGQTCKYYRPG